MYLLYSIVRLCGIALCVLLLWWQLDAFTTAIEHIAEPGLICPEKQTACSSRCCDAGQQCCAAGCVPHAEACAP